MAFDPLVGCFGWTPLRLPRGKEMTTKNWLWGLKLIMTILIGITAFTAKDRYDFVKRHPELRESPPYNKHVLLSHFLTYVGLISTFPWLFISCLLLWKATGGWIFWIGFIDLGLGAMVAAGVGLQGNYLPATTNGCTLAKAEAWQVVGNEKSFFVLAQEFGGDKNAGYACKTFVANWTLEVASVFFQMFVAYIGIFFDERETSLLNPLRPWVYLLLAIFKPPFYFHDHCMPRIRLGFRYAIKFVRRLCGAKELDFPKYQPYKPRASPIVVSNTRLQQILNIEHVLLNVVDYLHYEDLVNLSLTSRSVREAVYPAKDLAYRMPKLKKRCCQEPRRQPCLYCNKTICQGCHHEGTYVRMSAQRHVLACQPCCSRCYYHSFARHLRGYKRPCKCTPKTECSDTQQMCRSCSKRKLTELRSVRIRRYQQEAIDIANGAFLPPGEKPKCGLCKNELKSGTRFWVCVNCKGECRDSIHPPYVGKKKIHDLEQGEKHAVAEEEAHGSIRAFLSKLRHH